MIWYWPASNPLSARWRWPCVRFEWIATALNPARSSFFLIRSARYLVRENTIIRSTSSAWMRCSRSACFSDSATRIGPLGDGRGRVAALADLDGLGLVQDALGQVLDRRRHGRREQQRLALLRDGRHDLADVLDEAHVEHPVGLVEHQHVDVAQVEDALAHKVQQAARRGDDDVDAVAERVPLLALADAAVDGRDAEAGVLAVLGGRLGDLDRQLARRRDDERADRAGACRRTAP